MQEENILDEEIESPKAFGAGRSFLAHCMK
jgi:hypothetical protein